MSYPVFEQLGKQLDRESGSHLYSQVSGYLREKIDGRELEAGDSILPQRELSELWGISIITVRRAIRDLCREGVLVSRPGSGTFVAPPPWETKGKRSMAEVPASNSAPNGHKRAPVEASAGQRMPNSLAGNLAWGGQSPNERADLGEMLLVGVAVGRVTDGYPFFSRTVRGFRSGTEHGCALQFYEQPLGNREQLSSLAASVPVEGLSGMIFCPPVNVQLLARCQVQAVPYVLTDNDLTDGFSDCVFIDYAAGLMDTMSHLAERGRRSIALVTAAVNRSSTAKMVAGYEMALRHLNLPRDERWLLHGEYDDTQGQEATRQLLGLGDHRPDAIIFSSDYQARDAIAAAKDQGLDVPRDMAIVGHGNIFSSDQNANMLNLTTLDAHPETIGREAMSLLRARWVEPQVIGRRVAVRPELIVGQST